MSGNIQRKQYDVRTLLGVGFKHPPQQAVLLGRGKRQNSHSGNRLYRVALMQIIDARLEEYTGSATVEKNVIAGEVAMKLRGKGFRLMKQYKHDSLWRYLADSSVEMEKVKQAFRDRHKKETKSIVGCAASGGQNHEKVIMDLTSKHTVPTRGKKWDRSILSTAPSLRQGGAHGEATKPNAQISIFNEQGDRISTKPHATNARSRKGADKMMDRNSVGNMRRNELQSRPECQHNPTKSFKGGSETRPQIFHGSQPLENDETREKTNCQVAAVVAGNLFDSVEQLMGHSQTEIDRCMSAFEQHITCSGLLGQQDPFLLELRGRIQNLRTRHATEATMLSGDFRVDLEALCRGLLEHISGRSRTDSIERNQGDKI